KTMGFFTCIKLIMVVFNLLIFLGGGVLLGVGIWATVDSNSFVHIFVSISAETATQILNVACLLIAIGAVLVVISFLGCYGAQQESQCLLITFFTVILIIFVAQLVGTVIILVNPSKIRQAEDELKTLLKPVLQEEYGTNEQVTKLWNGTMNDLKCCGLSGYEDFINSNYVNLSHVYPSQCCNSTVMTCTKTNAQASDVQGCFESVLALIQKHIPIVGGVAAGICALELAAMMASIYLYCQLGDAGSMH
ncbi:tetraspanin-1, partial [Pelobates cultripes]